MASESADAPADPEEREALARLESAVGSLLAEMERLRVRATRAEARVRDVEALLRRFTTGEEDPSAWRERMSELEEENRALRDRIREGREGVERLLARIRFLEEAR